MPSGRPLMFGEPNIGNGGRHKNLIPGEYLAGKIIMRNETWQLLDDFFSKNPVLKAESVHPNEIIDAEVQVGILLDNDYKKFIVRYGGVIVGPFRIFGLRKALPMGKNEASFVDVTNSFRRQRWPGVENWAIISMDHAGNPVGIDGDGKVWISDHDAGAVQIIADNFEDYLRKHCLKPD